MGFSTSWSKQCQYKFKCSTFGIKTRLKVDNLYSFDAFPVELADYTHRSRILGLPSFGQAHSKSPHAFISIQHGFYESKIMLVKQGKKNKKYFWVGAIAPLISVILSTFIVYITRADKHGVKIVSILT